MSRTVGSVADVGYRGGMTGRLHRFDARASDAALRDRIGERLAA